MKSVVVVGDSLGAAGEDGGRHCCWELSVVNDGKVVRGMVATGGGPARARGEPTMRSVRTGEESESEAAKKSWS